jgi:K+/H+ antiporter YhaU regulatory subunit KhtT
VGKSIGELNLRAHSGASILAIQRSDTYLTALSPADRIEANDVLYLVGDESDVMLARQRLMEG